MNDAFLPSRASALKQLGLAHRRYAITDNCDFKYDIPVRIFYDGPCVSLTAHRIWKEDGKAFFAGYESNKEKGDQVSDEHLQIQEMIGLTRAYEKRAETERMMDESLRHLPVARRTAQPDADSDKT